MVSRKLCLLALLFFALVTAAYPQGNSGQKHPDDSTADVARGTTEPGVDTTQDKNMEGVEKDDPSARLEWEKKAWGTANSDFRRQVMRESHKHNEKLGRKRSNGTEPSPLLIGDGPTGPFSGPSLSGSGPSWISIGPTGANFEQNGSF